MNTRQNILSVVAWIPIAAAIGATWFFVYPKLQGTKLENLIPFAAYISAIGSALGVRILTVKYFMTRRRQKRDCENVQISEIAIRQFSERIFVVEDIPAVTQANESSWHGAEVAYLTNKLELIET